MHYIQKQIYGDTWTLYLSAEKDDVIIDEGSEAETDFHTREIWFRENEFKIETVVHELTHVFFGYTFTTTANLDGHHVEEIACELFSYKGKLILDISQEIYDDLKKLKEKK